MNSTNVKWFGAKGDGVTDDTQAIQKAIDFTYGKYLAALNTPSKTTANNIVEIPGGTYLVSAPINVRTNIKLVGSSTIPYPAVTAGYAGLENVRSGTTLKASPTFNGTGNIISLLDLGADNVSIEGLTIDGTDLPHGTWWSNIEVRTAQGITNGLEVKIPINKPGVGLRIDTESIDPFYAGGGTQYYQLQAMGGLGSYTWSVASGSLPTGFTLSSGGLLTATPTTSGQTFVTIQVSDGTNTARKEFTVSVPRPFIVDNRLYDLTQGETVIPYSLSAKSVGSTAVTWAMKYAPPGLVMSTSGQLSGTITAEQGTYQVEVTLSDATTVLDRRNYQIEVNYPDAGVRVLNTNDRPRYFQNTLAPNFQFRAVGGGGNYTWSIDTTQEQPAGFENQQPGFPTTTSPGPGLTLSSTGVLSGTPAGIGRYTFFVKAQSNTYANLYWAEIVILEVRQAGGRPTVSRIQFPTGNPGTAYTGAVTFQSITSAEPYTYSAKDLPAGLSINTSTGVISGTPTAGLKKINGVNLRWSAQIYKTTIRGFKGGAGIYVYGPSNKHVVENVVIAQCDIGIELATQVYDSHWTEGYIHGCRLGILMGSGAAAHNFNNYRIEYLYEHGVDMVYANENTFTSCYWDTCGWTGINASKSRALNVVGCRFFRSGRLLRGTGNHLITNAPENKSTHIALLECENAVITGNSFQVGSDSAGDSSEIGVDLSSNPEDFARPSCCLYFSYSPGLTVSGNNMLGSWGPAIVPAGGNYSNAVIEGNVIEPNVLLVRNVFRSRAVPDPVLKNGELNKWSAGTSFSLAPITTGTASSILADEWYIDRGSSITSNITIQRVETSGSELVPPCRYHLSLSKTANSGTTPGVYLYQYMQLYASLSDYMWELSGRDVIVSFYARSSQRNSIFSRVQIYPATDENNYGVFQVGGTTFNLSRVWQRFFFKTTLPDLRGLTLGKNGTAQTEIQFILDDASVNYDFNITGLRIEPADELFLPTDFKPFITTSTTSTTVTAPTSTPYTVKTSSFTALTSEEILACDATSGAITVTLPTASSAVAGKKYTIIKLDSSSNTVTVDPNGTETVNGQTTFALSARYQAIEIISTGSSWVILDQYNPPSTPAFITTGGIQGSWRATSASTTLQSNDLYLGVDASGGARTITLPALTGNTGRIYTVFKTDSTSNAVTLSSADTINGSTTQSITTQRGMLRVVCTGGSWYIEGSR